MDKKSYFQLFAGSKILQEYIDLRCLGIEMSPEAFAEKAIEQNHLCHGKSQEWKDKVFGNFMELLVRWAKI